MRPRCIQHPVFSVIALVGSLLLQETHALAGDRQIFIESCSGQKTEFDTNLRKACEKHPGKILVQCKHECTERKGFKCKERRWVPVKSEKAAVCQSDGDRNKTKGCSALELTQLNDALQSAKARTADLLTKVKVVAAKMGETKDPAVKKWEKTETCLKKIIEDLNKPYKYVCPDDDEGLRGKKCEKKDTLMAFVYRGGARKIFFCEHYFGFSAPRKASAMTHEVSHEACGTRDNGPHEGYYEDSREIRASHPWETTASTYDNFLDHGLCIPGKSSCQPYDAWLAAQRLK